VSYIYRRESGDRVYLEDRESYRAKGKVRNRFVRYLGAVVSRHDHTPLFHFNYRGSCNGGGTARNLLVQLQAAKIPPRLLTVDRKIMGKRPVEEARGVGWHLLGGLSKQPKEVRTLLDRTEVPETPTSFVKRSATGGIHAVKVRARLWEAEREWWSARTPAMRCRTGWNGTRRWRGSGRRWRRSRRRERSGRRRSCT
jgi:hypothetical protein